MTSAVRTGQWTGNQPLGAGTDGGTVLAEALGHSDTLRHTLQRALPTAPQVSLPCSLLLEKFTKDTALHAVDAARAMRPIPISQRLQRTSTAGLCCCASPGLSSIHPVQAPCLFKILTFGAINRKSPTETQK